ncbi:uncharacterized protein [Coffea arabica]|uniref:RNase H type-1 domain-containing protein n=1 Tax=Coffea arabica TaxID=13443 RepID=A0ABM4VMB2_COFAR
MYFDGAAHRDGAGAGVVFYTSEADVLSYSFTLTRRCSNNMAEYQALILGLETAVDMKQLHLRVYGDSKLVVNQFLGIYDVKKPELIPYYKYARQLMGYLDSVIPPMFDEEGDGKEENTYHIFVYEIEKEDWRHLIIDYLNHGKLPKNPKKKIDIRRRVPRFIYYKGTLYRRSFDGVFLRCLGEDEVVQAMEEAHSGICAMNKLCEKFHFKQYKSSMYYAAANRVAEAFNKTLCNLLKKIVNKSRKDWHLRIGEALWAYQTTFRTPTQATPYALVYGIEAVLPLECQIPSLRIAIQEGLSEEDNVRLRLEELEALDEKRLETQQRIECYQAHLSKAFNKHVRPRSFQIGKLVLAVRRPTILTHGGQRKFTPKWDGPYAVREVYTNGSYKLVAEDGLSVGPINGKYLKRLHVLKFLHSVISQDAGMFNGR